MTRSILRFLKTEAGGGALLSLTAIIAILVANSPLASSYFGVLKTSFAIDLGVWRVDMTVKEWVKDGLMALFFFVIGLELKREMTIGELSDPRTVALPVAAAFGGAVVPMVVYLLIAGAADPRGWPVPVATDIAFALAALAILAPRADPRLRIFLLTLAVVDDLLAIVLIAALFTTQLSLVHFFSALALLAAVWFVQRVVELPKVFYVALLIGIWALATQSGVHSSVMAVATAAVVPLTGVRSGRSVLEDLEHSLHPLSAYIVLPIFAFAAAGISFVGLGVESLAIPTTAGIALGLVIGKPIGVALAASIAGRMLKTPDPLPFGDLVRVGCLCGIGFTMSLFIGALAFAGDTQGETLMRLGVLTGSVMSLALAALLFALKARTVPRPAE